MRPRGLGRAIASVRNQEAAQDCVIRVADDSPRTHAFWKVDVSGLAAPSCERVGVSCA